MVIYYVTFKSRNHALLAGSCLDKEKYSHEIAQMPREIAQDLCNLGLKLSEAEYERASFMILHLGLPDSHIYKAICGPDGNEYIEINI